MKTTPDAYEAESDPFGVGNISGLYGAGTTLAFFLTLLAFYVDAFSWMHRGGQHAASDYLGSRKSKLPYKNKRPQDFKIPPSFGFNMNYLLVILYYGLVINDLVLQCKKKEKRSNFGSFVTVVGFHTVVVFNTELMMFSLINIIHFTHFHKSNEKDLGAISLAVNREFVISLLFLAVFEVSKIWAIRANLPGDNSDLPFWTNNDVYAHLISPTKDPKVVLTNPSDPNSVSTIVAYVFGNVTPSLSLILSIPFWAFSLLVLLFASALCLFSACLGYNFLISERGWLGEEWTKYFGLLLLNMIYIGMCLYCLFYFMAGMVEGAATTMAMFWNGFQILPGAPGSFSELDQIYAIVAAAISLGYSCHNARRP